MSAYHIRNYYTFFNALYHGVETKGVQIITKYLIDENALRFNNFVVSYRTINFHRNAYGEIEYVVYTFFKNPGCTDENFLSHLREHLESFYLVIMPFNT